MAAPLPSAGLSCLPAGIFTGGIFERLQGWRDWLGLCRGSSCYILAARGVSTCKEENANFCPFSSFAALVFGSARLACFVCLGCWCIYMRRAARALCVGRSLSLLVWCVVSPWALILEGGKGCAFLAGYLYNLCAVVGLYPCGGWACYIPKIRAVCGLC